MAPLQQTDRFIVFLPDQHAEQCPQGQEQMEDSSGPNAEGVQLAEVVAADLGGDRLDCGLTRATSEGFRHAVPHEQRGVSF